MKILKVVVKNEEKMPHFNLKDVMFLTNKWDSVESDNDSSDDEEEKDEKGKDGTYNYIMKSLSQEWPGVSNDNVFQVSLKLVCEVVFSRTFNM